MENIQEKMYEFESNMKNNLILYGISQEERETGERLVSKVREIIRSHFKIARDVVLTNVTRIYTGPEVQGCRPVLGTSQPVPITILPITKHVFSVTFESFKDKEDVLQASKCLRNSVISVTEDFSRKTREARQELRKFLRLVKKTNPERRCFLQYDKLYIDGKLFLYSEVTGQVEQQSGAIGSAEDRNTPRWRIFIFIFILLKIFNISSLGHCLCKEILSLVI